ncbi:MAG: DUF3347 domain-containing protein [Flavipsychrobacter sp.]|nr:DUF3347 domain-containing protein [Flavipsychrobacter sp.]
MRFIYLFLACAISLAACNNTSNKTAPTGDTLNKTATVAPKPPVSELNDNGTQILLEVVSKYYDVKNALVAINARHVDSSAQQLVVAADSLKALLQKDKIQQQLLPYTDTVLMTAKAITGSKDATCEEQRVPFSKLSDAFFVLLQKVQLKNAHVYLEHCPMALNEKGANWLSDESEIKNPYFGKKMLECGDVEDSLK